MLSTTTAVLTVVLASSALLVFEEHARWLLICHAVLGGGLCAVSTHLAVWVYRARKERRYRRGALRFAVLGAILFVAAMLLGNVLYPTYKIRVRAEYLDNPQAIARDLESRQLARTRLAEAAGAEALPAPPDRDEAIAHARKMARIFDIKEHLVALALPLALACPVLLWAAGREREHPIAERAALAFSILGAGVVWFAAIVGVLLTSLRSV